MGERWGEEGVRERERGMGKKSEGSGEGGGIAGRERECLSTPVLSRQSVGRISRGINADIWAGLSVRQVTLSRPALHVQLCIGCNSWLCFLELYDFVFFV